MIRRIIALLSIALLVSLGLAAFSVSNASAADDPSLLFGQTCDDPRLQTSDLCKNVEANPSNPIYGRDSILAKAVNVLSIIVGVAAIIMIIVGGINYMLSSGDPAKIGSAKSTIIFAVVGIVVALAARTIVVFVLNKL